MSQIIKRCYDVAGCNPKIKVYLNDKLIKLHAFNQYFDMYCEDAIYDKNDDWEICVGSNEDDSFKHLSFVNGIDTYEGGTHVDYVVNQITNA
ncbi:hypothetical protein, partial [Enterococcus faecium]|uniref:hypothetical protein n=1 Tax=Enterococcus faecium TaxID=1352 RepID=UPI0034E94B6D